MSILRCNFRILNAHVFVFASRLWKSVLSGVFSHAKNEGAFDGVNPIQDARIPRNAREARMDCLASLLHKAGGSIPS
jgi:hypothetical protein